MHPLTQGTCWGSANQWGCFGVKGAEMSLCQAYPRRDTVSHWHPALSLVLHSLCLPPRVSISIKEKRPPAAVGAASFPVTFRGKGGTSFPKNKDAYFPKDLAMSLWVHWSWPTGQGQSTGMDRTCWCPPQGPLLHAAGRCLRWPRRWWVTRS